MNIIFHIYNHPLPAEYIKRYEAPKLLRMPVLEISEMQLSMEEYDGISEELTCPKGWTSLGLSKIH